MFDIGANLANSQFKNDIKEVLIKAKEAGVNGILLTSVDLEGLNKNLEIIKQYSDIIFLKTTLGLHPHNAKLHSSIFNDTDFLNTHLANPDIISLGEFGLDYFRMLSEQKIQQYVMHKFMELAKSNPDKSLFLHERDAFEDFYHILKEHNVPNNAVVHCFCGNNNNMKKYLDLGCYLGFTGWISDKRRNADVIEAIKYIPEDKILIETDAPYLTPFNMPIRPRRNEPAYLKYVLESIAEIKNIDVNELHFVIRNNIQQFFFKNLTLD